MILLRQILVATDFSDASDAALAYGRELSAAFGASLHLLHVLENTFMRPVPADPYLLKAAASRHLADRITNQDYAQRHATATVATSDAPADEIVKYARAHQVDLIVVGTHGRAGMARLLLGSVAETVVRTAPCPVLTVRHPEHDFVVPDPPRVTATQEPGGLS
jgi:nucleotide-binding universal stress UspA family protein